MSKVICYFISTLILLQNIKAQQFRSFKDPGDGKVYKTVKIREQEWMVENLNVSTFRNGDSIPHAKTNQDWDNAGKEGRPAWCYYENNTNNGIKYGKLYNWYAVIDKRGLAPKGWHIARKSDWETLIQYLGGINESGLFKFNYESFFKSEVDYKTFWGNISGERSSLSGFNNTAIFGSLGEDSYSSWWSTPIKKIDLSRHNYYQYRYDSKILVHVLDCLESEGHSVRCIKDN